MNASLYNLNLLILNHYESGIEQEENLVKWLLVPRNRLKYQECHEKLMYHINIMTSPDFSSSRGFHFNI